MTRTRTCVGPCGGTHPETNDHFPWREEKRGTFRTRCHSCYAEYHTANKAYSRERWKIRVSLGGPVVDFEKVPKLPVGPIRQYLRLKRPDFDDDRELARLIGIRPKTVRLILRGDQARFSLDTVDKILCAFEDASRLRELYPELYDYDEIEAEAWIEEWVDQGEREWMANAQSHS
jgi:transcriptional regulator with XRE-family HTH domain